MPKVLISGRRKLSPVWPAELRLAEADSLAAMGDENYKQKLKDVTADAIERNVCGSPFFFIGSEPFWGSDRLEMMDLWLKKGC